MNWIIRKSDKLNFHTDLTELLRPVISELDNCQWLFTDLDFIADEPLQYLSWRKDFNLLSANQLHELTNHRVQFIWGSILAIPNSCNVHASINELPYVEGNDLIWKNGNLQHPEARMEINCFDSSYTIVKFADQSLSDSFKAYFDEAIELEKFK